MGGHCIPIDPFYLTWKARQYDFHTRFIELAGELNVEVSYYVINKVISALNGVNKSLKDSNIFVLGVAYKKDIDDVRESPALKIMELLRKNGANINYHDPYIPRIEPHSGITFSLESLAMTDEELAGADCILILTDHSSVNYHRVVENAQLVVDTRNATKNVEQNRDKITKI